MVACAAASLCWASPARSQPATGLVVIPRSFPAPGLSYFKLQATPGRVERAGAIELLNPTTRTLRVALAPVDGETLSTLGSSYRPRGSRASGSTRWLLVSRRALTLPPSGRAVATVSVLVPPGAGAGDYLSGVSIEELRQRARSAARDGVSTASAVRYAIGVETSLPGPRRPLIRFTGATLQREPAGLTFLLRAEDSGNVILQNVHGHVLITRDGRTVVSRPIPAGTFLAHTAIAYPVPAFGERPAEGERYGISAWMRYRGGIARLDTTVTFGHRAAVVQQRFGGPGHGQAGTEWWKGALLAAAILYGLLTTVLLLRRRRSRGDAEQPGKAVEPHAHIQVGRQR